MQQLSSMQQLAFRCSAVLTQAAAMITAISTATLSAYGRQCSGSHSEFYRQHCWRIAKFIRFMPIICRDR
jgi:hypothetical protein